MRDHKPITRQRAGTMRSWRLQETWRIIREARGCLVSSEEIRRATHSQAVHSDVSRLRTLGKPVSRAIYIGRSPRTGSKINGYKVERLPAMGGSGR